jgi:hypothetical protein
MMLLGLASECESPLPDVAPPPRSIKVGDFFRQCTTLLGYQNSALVGLLKFALQG